MNVNNRLFRAPVDIGDGWHLSRWLIWIAYNEFDGNWIAGLRRRDVLAHIFPDQLNS